MEIAGSALGAIKTGAFLKVGSNYYQLWDESILVNPLDLDSFDGVLKASGTVHVKNLTGTVYQNLVAANVYAAALVITGAGGNIVSGGPVQVLAALGGAAQNVHAGGLLVSSNYGATYNIRVPTNGIYSLGGITTSGGISSYDSDLYIARAGVSKLGLFTWGTYAYGSFTLDDILAINNVLTVEPPAPATGAKLYLINRAGTIWLEAKFANGQYRGIVKNN